MISSIELRQKYIDFFKNHGHAVIPSAPIIPENDPSVLFTTAGMHPLVPFLMGEKHPAGSRLVNSQKCVRTGDIDEVGDNTHHTFFEMLGHWSLGDYFKSEAIEMSYKFFIEYLKLDKNRLAVTVFGGNENAPQDQESADLWLKLGVSSQKIAFVADNWWEPGSAGPCGPDTEPHYWADNHTKAPDTFDPEDSRWVEIGNDVLMQYKKTNDGRYYPAEQKNIDNGTGLERTLAAVNGLGDNYQTDLFLPLIAVIEHLSSKKYISSIKIPGISDNNINTTRSMRIIADHLRAASFIMGDDIGIYPSNVDQGYVVRKLIRRAMRHGRMIGIRENFTHKIGQTIIALMAPIYPELSRNQKFIINNLKIEEQKFTETLQKGLKQLEKQIQDIKNGCISGDIVFDLYQTYGFPVELTQELAQEKNLNIDTRDFESRFKQHQQLSRTASAGKFKGGLGDMSSKSIRYHTATHLLHQALRQVLGSQVEQRGSNITDKRLRFDFSYNQKLTEEQKNQVENIVNQIIDQNLPIKCEQTTVDKAKAAGAVGLFGSKYGEKVKVYSVGNFSKEICGGPHAKTTGELGHFKIIKEEASSAGVRRIKAVLE